MRYNVAQLIKGPTGAFRQYDVEADIRDLDDDLEPVTPLEGSVTLLRTSQGILVTGRLRTRLRVECHRCLDLCDVDVEIDLEEEFYPTVRIADAAPVDETPETDQDEALQIDEHHVLDLSEVVRQDLWLAQPMEALCRPDCAGICPTCGGNRNLGECQCEQVPLDPRWGALRALLTDESDS